MEYISLIAPRKLQRLANPLWFTFFAHSWSLPLIHFHQTSYTVGYLLPPTPATQSSILSYHTIIHTRHHVHIHTLRLASHTFIPTYVRYSLSHSSIPLTILQYFHERQSYHKNIYILVQTVSHTASFFIHFCLCV